MRPALIAALAALCLVPLATAEEQGQDICAALTAEEVTALLGEPAEPRPPKGAGEEGVSECQWVETKTFRSFSISLRAGKALGGKTAEEYFELYRWGMEDVAAIGDAAAIVDEGSLIRMVVRLGDRILAVNAPGLERDKTIEAARLVSTRL